MHGLPCLLLTLTAIQYSDVGPVPIVGRKLWAILQKIKAFIPQKLGHPLTVFIFLFYVTTANYGMIFADFGLSSLRLSCSIISASICFVFFLALCRKCMAKEKAN